MNITIAQRSVSSLQANGRDPGRFPFKTNFFGIFEKKSEIKLRTSNLEIGVLGKLKVNKKTRSINKFDERGKFLNSFIISGKHLATLYYED
ncbi:hypothetical protein NLC29_00940 [Candidatus Aminicenantes bacterium AH-873-B07]|nr:hypothetical protein [Candidatus Aminicenantes bacterium AH-873-B07]